MKKIFLLILVSLPLVGFSQELKLNPDNHFYEFATVVDIGEPNSLEMAKDRLNTLNYKGVGLNDSILMGQGLTSHLVSGFAPVEITYLAKYEFKANKYRLVLTGFVLKDRGNAATPLENAGAFKNKWIKIINSKLPEIVSQLRKLEPKKEW